MTFKKLMTTLLAACLFFSLYGCSDSKTKDLEITQKVQNLVAQNKNISPKAKIRIDTKDAIVTLSGNVTSKQEEAMIIKIVESTEGIKKVESKLMIQSADMLDTQGNSATETQSEDSNLINAIKMKMGADLKVPATVEVEITNGIVILTGSVDDKEQETYVTDLIKSVEGVKELKSKLQIKTSSGAQIPETKVTTKPEATTAPQTQ